MEIGVDGWRASVTDWEAVRNLPPEQLPRLSDAQREVARKLGVREGDYARSALAGERTRDALLRKTERLARILDRQVGALEQNASVERVVLRTVEDRFDVDLKLNGTSVPLRIEESLVDDFFDGGSAEAEERLKRVLERALRTVLQ